MSLPDTPRWVETRSLLLSGEGEIFGVDETTGKLNFIVCSPTQKLICVVGYPNQKAVEKAVTTVGEESTIIAAPESSNYITQVLPNWRSQLAWLHTLPDSCKLPEVPPGKVRLLSADEIGNLKHLPPELQTELAIASDASPIAATIADGVPVSFCYAAQTETLWDISIGTLAEYRNRGYAALCVAYMVKYMHQKGKQPIWGAEESNLPSMKLAAKLGFIPVDRLILLHQ
ncbi:GNAT family N-acetyltransferase [Chroococcidiopsis sp. SAG 2025]|uniref:GNAT family N-acetyltransferase n=1 Tax=Chroococcidiopsis sp. SAG 2025 TaxID=171389 RepID=UPI002936F4AE|nr:GNAT family N-acetyltransferase [Chroococcidiopsis sp. SAG 2025]